MRTEVAILIAVITVIGVLPAIAQGPPVSCSWTDNPIVAGQTPIRAEHINEIRACLDAIIANWPGTTDPPPPPPPPGLLTSFGAGTWLVNEEIAPGRYFTEPAHGCYWERVSGLSGTLSDVIANEFLGFDSGQEIVDVGASDRAFKPDAECATWGLSPFPAPPSGTITPGLWLVGSQVPAGTYTATVPRGCYYEGVESFGGTLGEIIDNEFIDEPTRVTLTIDSSVTGFYTDDDCGTWSRTTGGATAAVEAASSVVGEFETDRDIIRENRQRHEAGRPR